MEDKARKKEFLNWPNNDEVEGCGAEYGRHSKSIDPRKHRCGRCKGFLRQIQPQPRARAKENISIKETGSSNDKTRAKKGEQDGTSSLGLGVELEGLERGIEGFSLT